MMATGHEEMKDLVAAYVLGALPSNEAALVRAHILSCDECIGEADVLESASHQLALAVEPAPVPAGFTERVMAAAIGETAAASVPKEGRRWGWSPWQRTLASAGALALLAALIFVSSELAETRRELATEQRALNALVHAEETFAMEGPNGAVARVVATPSRSYLITAGMNSAPKEHDYQLWMLIEGEDPISAEVFDIDGSVSVIEIEAEIHRADQVAVTVEPDGGSLQPTNEPIMVSSVPEVQ